MKNRLFILALLTVLILAACSPQSSAPENNAGQQERPAVNETQQSEAPCLPEAEGTLTVTSSGIKEGVIDPAYGAKGEWGSKAPAVSLPLEIAGAPEGTACFAVYMDDIDSVSLCGYRWVHWMAVNLTEGSLPEDFSRQAGAAVQGVNDFGTVGYAGPTPPDKDHTYSITVYALDAELSLSEGFSKEEFAQAIKGHVVGSAVLEGLYRK